MDAKLAALRAHASQHRQPEELEDRIRGWAQRDGEALGLEAAEAYAIIDLPIPLARKAAQDCVAR